MRIAMFMPELRPDALGMPIYRDLSSAIAALGHSFECLGGASGDATPAAERWLGALPLSDRWIRIGALAAPWLRHRRFLATVAALKRFLARRADLDVLHVEIAYPTGAAAALAIALSRWRGVLSISPMGEDVLVVDEASYGFRRHAAPRALVSWALRRADVIRCISPLVRELVERQWPGRRSATVPLNVAAKTIGLLQETAAAREQRRLRARQGLEHRYSLGARPVVLALGRLHPFKGLDVLVRALAGVAEARLLIAGPSLRVAPYGDVATQLAGIARELGVADRTHFLGGIPPAETAELLAGADVVAVPSLLESMNRVCVEAAAVGTAFVATQTTGVTGWFPRPDVGLVVPPRDPDALAAALNRVIHQGWRADRDATAAFVEQFSPARVGRALVDLYAPLVGKDR